MKNNDTIERLVQWIQETVPENKGVLIPVSGGSDSALCFWLYSKALGQRTEAVYIGTDLRQKNWFENIGQVHYGELHVGNNPEVSRWAYFLSRALQEDRILVGSKNRTEDTLGTYSLASRVASHMPLAGLWKHEVMELCEHIDMPKEIIQSSYRADPECGRPESMAAIPFEVVDTFLQTKVTALISKPDSQPSPEQEQYLEKVYASNQFKHHLPIKGPATA